MAAPDFFRKTEMALGAFPGVRSTLLYHVSVAEFSAFIVVSAVSVTSRVEGVKNGNILLYNTQASYVDLRLRSQPSNRRVVFTVTLMARRRPHHLAREFCLVRRRVRLGEHP